jgi:hypothetical protein
MSDFSIGTGKVLGAYALILGIAYATVGPIELLRGEALIPGDLPRVAVLLVIAATYLMGVRDLLEGKNDGLAFLMAGMLLSLAVGGLYLLTTGAEGLMYALGEIDEFSVMGSIKPASLLLVLALPLLPLVRRLTRGMVW